jgi:hypothetical protein
MPKNYTPQRLYYSENITYHNRFVFVFVIEEAKIKVYSFFKLNFMDNAIPDSCYVTNAAKFFSTPIGPTTSRQVQKKPFCEQETLPDNVIKFKDIQALNIFNYYGGQDSVLDLETLYLRPEYAYYIEYEDLNLNKIDPNIDTMLEYISTFNKVPFRIYNNSNDTKTNNKSIASFNLRQILSIGSNFGNLNSFLEADYIVSPKVRNFMSNLTFTSGLNSTRVIESSSSGSGVVDYEYQNRLRLKVDGPSTANIGDILEYNVTLMNYDFTDTYINTPDIEVYPTTEAGVLLHRKVILKNGIGKFKIDTSNLYSGDTFDVKIGWKYRTSDSKVTVTVN